MRRAILLLVLALGCDGGDDGPSTCADWLACFESCWIPQRSSDLDANGSIRLQCLNDCGGGLGSPFLDLASEVDGASGALEDAEACYRQSPVDYANGMASCNPLDVDFIENGYTDLLEAKAACLAAE